MHLNPTLSAPGGPAPAGETAKTPSLGELGDWGRSTRRSRLRFAAPSLPVPGWGALWDARRRSFWTWVEWSRLGVGPCCPGGDRESGQWGPAVWDFARFHHWFLLAPAGGQESKALALCGAQVRLCTVACRPWIPEMHLVGWCLSRRGDALLEARVFQTGPGNCGGTFSPPPRLPKSNARPGGLTGPRQRGILWARGSGAWGLGRAACPISRKYPPFLLS